MLRRPRLDSRSAWQTVENLGDAISRTLACSVFLRLPAAPKPDSVHRGPLHATALASFCSGILDERRQAWVILVEPAFDPTFAGKQVGSL